MKNRTIIGIICMVIAVILIFAISPLVSQISSDTINVPRLCTDVSRGVKIEKSNIETVAVKKDTLPAEVITDSNFVIGKYTTSALFSGDYLTNKKITANSNTAEDVIYSLNGKKFAMSFTIDSFAAGLSGKLKNGDIISLVVKGSGGKSVMPAAFKYVEVVTTTTSGGIDQDKIVKNDDGSFDPPTTVTLLVNDIQAELLADYEAGTISCVLVYRGSAKNAQKFLDKQDEFFAKSEAVNDNG